MCCATAATNAEFDLGPLATRVPGRPGVDALIGAETGLRHAMALVRRVAARDTTVLLRGETGTGKELVARTLHQLSPRRRQPFVVVNCAAIPRELMESEMFGHARGAFTGAHDDHAGHFEAAGRGTLLLDEIGDLALELQAKILRVLEDGTFRRVGCALARHSHARVICSTTQPLELLVDKGRFREDLFYRVNVFPVEIPPLRQRREDIVPIAEHFLQRFAAGHATVPRLTPDVQALLRDHPWWGNVRELRNCIERAVLVHDGHVLDMLTMRPLLDDARAVARTLHLLPIADLERLAIQDTLSRCDGNRTRAAALLGIGRRTLQKKLKQFNAA
jgi:transcriptional regulator with PAS, ATPase and Fis domain